MPLTPIERFLTRRAANDYAVEHPGLWSVSREVFRGREELYRLYSPALLEAGGFLRDLAAALASGPKIPAPTAKQWAYFLKGPVVVFDSWSSLCAAFGALFGLAAGLTAVATQANRQAASTLTILLLVVLSVQPSRLA